MRNESGLKPNIRESLRVQQSVITAIDSPGDELVY